MERPVECEVSRRETRARAWEGVMTCEPVASPAGVAVVKERREVRVMTVGRRCMVKSLRMRWGLLWRGG